MKKNWLKKSNKGFSLVELIVVIAIMAILVGIAVPVYSGYIEKTQKTKDMQMVDEVKHAIVIAAIGDNWANKYSISQDGTYIGAIVLKPDNGAAEVVQETIIGTALHDALTQTFGTDYSTELTLSYDEWEGTLAASNLDAFVGSSYYGNIPTLMGDIQSLTGALKTLLSDETYKSLLDGSFGDWLIEDAKIDTTNKQAVANAAILYVANDATTVNKEAFLAQWKESQVGSLMTGFSSTGITRLSAAAAEYAKAEAVVSWMGCTQLQEEFSQASAGLGNISEGTELDAIFAPLNTLFRNHINGENICQACLTKSQQGDYYGRYAADVERCEKDAQAYLSLLGQVSESKDMVLSDIENPNLYASESLTSYVSNFVSVAAVLNQTGASDGSVVIVFTLDADGSIKGVTYPLDYIR